MMGYKLWQNRAHSINTVGAIPYGFIADICQGDSQLPLRPFIEVCSEDEELARKFITEGLGSINVIAPILTEMFYNDFYSNGGIGFSILPAISVASCDPGTQTIPYTRNPLLYAYLAIGTTFLEPEAETIATSVFGFLGLS